MARESGAEGTIDRDRLDGLSDEELVDIFLDCCERNRQSAHICFEAIIARYQGLIAYVVRNSRFRFPAWDSADDVIARAIFKVYRGLSQWRRQGKLASFIGRIASSEMIDTMRRITRDKTWDPRVSQRDGEVDKSSAVDLAASLDPTPEEAAVRREQRTLIDQLLADACRDWKDSVIVNDYIVNKLSAKEIEEKFGISEDLVYQRARRLRVRLLKWLAEHGVTSAEDLLGSPAALSRRRLK